MKYQNAPNVLASADGTVRSIEISEGKKIADDDGDGEATAFTLGTGGATKMTVAVDELDVNNVAVGQSATVTLDAFSTEVFTATVTRISHIGEASGSITTYSTDLTLPFSERLMDGMNGSAVILSDSVQNALVIPLGAIHEDADGSYVYLLTANGAQSKVYVKTGLADGTNAEVLSGLSENDSIVYAAPSTRTTMMGFGSMGSGMGGNMPFGGGAQ